MNCPRCGAQIALGAAWCPRCALPLAAQPWQPPLAYVQPTPRRSPLVWLGLAIAVLFVCALAIAAASRVASTAGASPTPAGPAVYRPGDTATVTRDGWTVKITVSDVQVVDSYKGDYVTEQPQVQGDVFISAKVTYEAVTDHVSYGVEDWSAYCAGTAVSTGYVLYGPEPDLGFGSLIAGRNAFGYLVWEVPATGEVRMDYKAVIFDDTPTFEVIVRSA